MHFWFCFLYFFAVIMCANAESSDKQVNEKAVRTRPRSPVTPFEFLSSPQIYLLRTNATLPGFQCIQARTLSKDKNSRTLFQKVYVKITSSKKWITINATYEPALREGRRVRRLFTSFDCGTNTTTNYAFPVSTTKRACTIAKKEKGSSSKGFHHSCELWVTDVYLNNTNSQELKFCDQMFNSKCSVNSGQLFDAKSCRDLARDLL
uniref:Putative lipocalin n=1 Tax=Amblyomma triste TaxID=251400 RepID=A0A023G9R9_AMBTT